MMKKETTPWHTNGNFDIDPTEQFLGTKDANPFILKTNDLERFRAQDDGKIGINNNSPDATLDIQSAFNNKPALKIQMFPTQFMPVLTVLNQGGNEVVGIDAGGGLFNQDPNFPFGSNRFGQFNTASPQSSTFGYLASAFNINGNGTAFGYGVKAEGFKASAFGHDCEVTGDRSSGFGAGIRSSFNDSVYLGNAVIGTKNNELIAGSIGSPITSFKLGTRLETTNDNKLGWFGRIPEIIKRQFVIPAQNLTQGVTSPSINQRGPLAVDVFNLRLVAEELKGDCAIPTQWDHSDFEIVLDFALSDIQTNGNALDIDFNYQIWQAESPGNGQLKTVTNTTGQVIVTTANGLAIGDIYRMRIMLDANDGDNPLANADGMSFSLNLSNILEVGEIDLKSVCLAYTARY